MTREVDDRGSLTALEMISWSGLVLGTESLNVCGIGEVMTAGDI